MLEGAGYRLRPDAEKKGIIYKTIPKTVFPRHLPPSPGPHPALFVVPAQAGIQRMDTGFRRGVPLVAPTRRPGESRGDGERCPLDSGLRRNDEGVGSSSMEFPQKRQRDRRPQWSVRPAARFSSRCRRLIFSIPRCRSFRFLQGSSGSSAFNFSTVRGPIPGICNRSSNVTSSGSSPCARSQSNMSIHFFSEIACGRPAGSMFFRFRLRFAMTKMGRNRESVHRKNYHRPRISSYRSG